MNADERENIVKVWEEFLEKRDQRTRNTLIVYYFDIVKRIAERIHSRLPKSVELEDLISVGLLGLIKAIYRYNPARKTPFEVYCVKYIWGRIFDDLRKKDWTPRLVRHRSRQLQKVTHKLEALFGRLPTETELAEELGMDMETFYHFQQDATTISVLSLDRCLSNTNPENGFCEMDVITNQHSQNPFYEVQKKNLIEYVTKGFSKEEKILLILYYYEEMTMKEIGMTLGISESRVCQMHSVIINKLRSQLNKQVMIEEVTSDKR